MRKHRNYYSDDVEAAGVEQGSSSVLQVNGRYNSSSTQGGNGHARGSSSAAVEGREGRGRGRSAAVELARHEEANPEEGVGLTGQGGLQKYEHNRRELIVGAFFKYLMWVLAIGPWKVIKGVSWVLNRWQRFVYPVSYGVFYGGDAMDKTMPTVRAVIVWLWNTTSLALHFVDVILIFAVINIVARQGHWVSITMGLLYFFSHYFMGVIMYMENDRPIDCPVYSVLDFINFARRQLDVVFFDIQLLSSVIHSNIMIEGMTQMMLQGYEEARVCLHMLMNSIPAAIILGVLFDAIKAYSQFQQILANKGQINLIYAAFMLAVLNVVDKWIRLSLADPWLHPLNQDGYPLLYMRSNAARLPRALVLDFVFRCNVQLAEQDDKLTLRPLYDKYIINCRGEAKHLADGHKMALLRKVLRTFNTGAGVRVNRAERLARKVDQHVVLRDQALSETRTVRSLDASNIRPGPHLSRMLEEVLSETAGFDELSLADNRLSDDCVSHVVEGLRHNLNGLQIRDLDLSNNDIMIKGAEAVATYIMQYKCVVNLNMSNNINLGPAGIKGIASVLNEDSVLERLDLSHCNVGAEGAAVLGAMLKGNKGLRVLLLANTRLGTAGVDSICKGVARNTRLKELDLSRTGCDDKAAGHLAAALQQNNVLEKLSIGGNRITDMGAKTLADALQANTGLHHIDLSGCPMDKSWKKLLHNIMKGQGGGGGGGGAGAVLGL